MAFCPECRTSYEPGVVACRDCRVPLVESLEHEPPDAAGVEWVDLVHLADVPNAVTAAMWKGALESQGLHAKVRPNVLPAYGEVLRDWSAKAWGSLVVPADELAEAKLVLEDFLAAAASTPPVDDEEEGTAEES